MISKWSPVHLADGQHKSQRATRGAGPGAGLRPLQGSAGAQRAHPATRGLHGADRGDPRLREGALKAGRPAMSSLLQPRRPQGPRGRPDRATAPPAPRCSEGLLSPPGAAHPQRAVLSAEKGGTHSCDAAAPQTPRSVPEHCQGDARMVSLCRLCTAPCAPQTPLDLQPGSQMPRSPLPRHRGGHTRRSAPASRGASGVPRGRREKALLPGPPVAWAGQA